MTRIEIYDTTLRDGSQAEGISFSLQDKLLLTKRLDNLGFDYVEGGYPASNAKDSQYFQQVRELALQHVKVCAFGMTRRKGGEAEKDRACGPCSTRGPGRSRSSARPRPFRPRKCCSVRPEENLAMIHESVALLRRGGTRGDLRRRALLRRLEARRRLRPGRRSRPPPAPGPGWSCSATPTAAACPRKSPGSPREAVAGLSVPVGIHCHNDCDLAVANTLAAVRRGRGPGPGHDQRLRRAVRQRRPDLGGRQPGDQEAGLRGAPAGQRRPT